MLACNSDTCSLKDRYVWSQNGAWVDSWQIVGRYLNSSFEFSEIFSV